MENEEDCEQSLLGDSELCELRRGVSEDQTQEKLLPALRKRSEQQALAEQKQLQTPKTAELADQD